MSQKHPQNLNLGIKVEQLLNKKSRGTDFCSNQSKGLDLTYISEFFIPYFIVISLEMEGSRSRPLVFPG